MNRISVNNIVSSVNNVVCTILTTASLVGFATGVTGTGLAEKYVPDVVGKGEIFLFLLVLLVLLLCQSLFIDEMAERIWERAYPSRYPYYILAFLLAGYGAGVWLTIPLREVASGKGSMIRLVFLTCFFLMSFRRNILWGRMEYMDKVQLGYKVVAVSILFLIMSFCGLM